MRHPLRGASSHPQDSDLRKNVLLAIRDLTSGDAVSGEIDMRFRNDAEDRDGVIVYSLGFKEAGYSRGAVTIDGVRACTDYVLGGTYGFVIGLSAVCVFWMAKNRARCARPGSES
jgi:hypothetical protein